MSNLTDHVSNQFTSPSNLWCYCWGHLYLNKCLPLTAHYLSLPEAYSEGTKFQWVIIVGCHGNNEEHLIQH